MIIKNFAYHLFYNDVFSQMLTYKNMYKIVAGPKTSYISGKVITRYIKLLLLNAMLVEYRALTGSGTYNLQNVIDSLSISIDDKTILNNKLQTLINKHKKLHIHVDKYLAHKVWNGKMPRIKIDDIHPMIDDIGNLVRDIHLKQTGNDVGPNPESHIQSPWAHKCLNCGHNP